MRPTAASTVILRLRSIVSGMRLCHTAGFRAQQHVLPACEALIKMDPCHDHRVAYCWARCAAMLPTSMQVNDRLQTSQKHIFAVGDCCSVQQQFTHASDFMVRACQACTASSPIMTWLQ